MADPTPGLVATLIATGESPPAIDVATVTATVAGLPPRVTVKWNGETTTIPRLKAYAPVVGEVALLARQGAALVALGALS